MSADAVERRYRVFELRVQLERAAVAAHRAVCPSASAVQKDICGKLLFLVGLVEPARRAEVHRLARLAGHVYARTSDVLHARASAPDVPNVVVNEWSSVVEDVVAVVSRAEQVREPGPLPGTKVDAAPQSGHPGRRSLARRER